MQDKQDEFEDDKRVTPPADEDCPKEEQDLDEGLYDTFPASDPVTAPQKSEPAGMPTPEEIDRAQKTDRINKE